MLWTGATENGITTTDSWGPVIVVDMESLLTEEAKSGSSRTEERAAINVAVVLLFLSPVLEAVLAPVAILMTLKQEERENRPILKLD